MKRPINVAIDRNYLDFNLTFPSITLCPVQRLDPSKLDKVLKGLHGHKRTEFNSFLSNLANFPMNTLKEVLKQREFDPKTYFEVNCFWLNWRK